MYNLTAWYPNSRTEPLKERSPRLETATTRALELRLTQQHTTISVTTPDGLELVKLWGQPMPNGRWWP